jgi:hypothetical protein
LRLRFDLIGHFLCQTQIIGGEVAGAMDAVFPRAQGQVFRAPFQAKAIVQGIGAAGQVEAAPWLHMGVLVAGGRGLHGERALAAGAGDDVDDLALTAHAHQFAGGAANDFDAFHLVEGDAAQLGLGVVVAATQAAAIDQNVFRGTQAAGILIARGGFQRDGDAGDAIDHVAHCHRVPLLEEFGLVAQGGVFGGGVGCVAARRAAGMLRLSNRHAAASVWEPACRRIALPVRACLQTNSNCFAGKPAPTPAPTARYRQARQADLNPVVILLPVSCCCESGCTALKC